MGVQLSPPQLPVSTSRLAVHLSSSKRCPATNHSWFFILPIAQMSDPTYDGPKCHKCLDLMPNNQFPLPDGKWVDYRAQGRDGFHLNSFLAPIRESAESCNNCATIVDALDLVEGGKVDVDDDFLTLTGRLGGVLDMTYLVNGEVRDIEIFATPDGPGSGNTIGPAPIVATEMNPILAATHVRSLLDRCRNSHVNCGSDVPGIPPMPRRVVYLGSDDGIPRLIDTVEKGTREPYIALSYCWGLSPTLTTTTATYDSRTAAIPWASIPKTLSEAMQFAVALGVSHIWIDALCILQDNAADWAREAAKMKDVYENALLTLSATSSPDVSSGIFFPRTKLTYPLPSAKSAVSARRPCIETHDKLFNYAGDDDRNLLLYPAMARGWIFQERLLSRRVVYCAHDEIIWECRAEIVCECAGVGKYQGRTVNALAEYKRQDWASPDKAGFRVLKMWLDLLATYTHREFTLYSDRLVAISGIAKKFAPLGLGRYLAGVWEEFLPEQLAWARYPGGRTRSSRRVSGGPSWSWGSVNQPCHFEHVMPRDWIKTEFKVVDSQLVLKTDDPTGPVDMARLTISAPMVKGTLVTKPNRLKESENYYMVYVGQTHADLLEVLVNIDGKEYVMIADVCQWGSPDMRDEMQPEEVLWDGDAVSCVELYQTEGADPDDIKKRTNMCRFPWLVLRWSPQNDAYRRIGLIDWSNRNDFKMETQPLGSVIALAEKTTFDLV